jgi:8-oxo-dGTP diphosphatase
MPGGNPVRDGGEFLQIAAAVILDPTRRRVLLARRPAHRAHGGLWEFPGGKQEPGESIEQALARELHEELAIDVGHARPFLRIPHDYPQFSVELHVRIVDEWRGEPRAMEGQALEWVALEELAQREFPAANLDIVAALQLPEILAIKPDLAHYDAGFHAMARMALERGVRAIQFRSRRAGGAARMAALRQLAQMCRAAGARLLVNGSVEEMRSHGAHGLHLSAAALLQLRERPLPRPAIVGASCHDERELAHAERIGVDYALLGPVLPTTSHPEVTPLGWQGFRELLRQGRRIPVYALGGLGIQDLPRARDAGACGVAMISALWPPPLPACGTAPAPGQ